MDRESYYRKRQVSSVEDVAASYHYAAAAAVFLLLLSGIPAAGYFSGDNLAKKEKAEAVGHWNGKTDCGNGSGNDGAADGVIGIFGGRIIRLALDFQGQFARRTDFFFSGIIKREKSGHPVI